MLRFDVFCSSAHYSSNIKSACTVLSSRLHVPVHSFVSYWYVWQFDIFVVNIIFLRCDDRLFPTQRFILGTSNGVFFYRTWFPLSFCHNTQHRLPTRAPLVFDRLMVYALWLYLLCFGNDLVGSLLILKCSSSIFCGLILYAWRLMLHDLTI